MKLVISLLISLCPFCSIFSQTEAVGVKRRTIIPFDSLTYDVTFQSSFSKGKTPMWLNANKYGLSSLDNVNGYLMAGVSRDLATDSMRRWGIGYGVDLVKTVNYTSSVVAQQAYGELRWLKGVLTVGSKEQPMEMKNNMLSSGAQTFGINARPVPQIRIALPEYYTPHFLNGWFHIKGNMSYGLLTDQHWQQSFTGTTHKYVNHTLYHGKAGYVKIGKNDAALPLTVELGLEMATLFGGTTFLYDEYGKRTVVSSRHDLRSFWNAFVPGGSDATDGVDYPNVEGDNLGSWVARVSYDADKWILSVYADKFFEDHSSMFLLDYDGYGVGDEWMEKKHNKFFMYDMKDIMLGAELNLKNGRWVRNIVFEYLYTKYQSGPLYHDHTINIADHVAGQDDYYNHNLYAGWQHWGQVIGNPLFLSPIYNTDHNVYVRNNRFMAFHLGVDGRPLDNVYYCVLASWQDGLGTYDRPYNTLRHNVSISLEASYAMPKGWTATVACGFDRGLIRGNNYGVQLTVTRRGILGL